MESSYVRLHFLGWAHVIMGALALVCGLCEIVWTAAKYGWDCRDSDIMDDVDTCGGTHVYTYIAAPVWGGIVIVVCGVVGMRITPRRLSRHKYLVDVFRGLAMLLLSICSALVALQTLELIHGEGHFYRSTDDGLVYHDKPKFVLATTQAVIGAMELVVAIATIIVTSLCGPPLPARNSSRAPVKSAAHVLTPCVHPEDVWGMDPAYIPASIPPTASSEQTSLPSLPPAYSTISSLKSKDIRRY